MVRSRFTRRALIGAAALAAGAGAVACSSTGGGGASDGPLAPPPAARKKVLTIGATLEPPTFDLTTNDSASIPQVLLYNVYETLVKLDSDGKVRPLLATRWGVDDAGRVYTFTLDPGARFASGSPVDAEAVIASIERMKRAVSATVASAQSLVERAEAVDATTVRITLSRPSNTWLYHMTSKPGMIIDPAATDLDTTPMGSGPYRLSGWAKGSRVSLERNPDYWATPGRFDEVVFSYYVEPNAMASAMLSGDLDVISNLQAPSSLAQFQDTSRFTVFEGTTNGEVTLGFNHRSPALSNLKVRQAICHAIDRTTLLETVWDGHGTLIGTMAAPTDPYYVDLAGRYPYDPDRARQLLAESGVGPVSLRLRVPLTKYATDAAQFIAARLGEVGVTTTIEELDFGGRWYPEVFQKADYDLTIVAHVEARDIVRFADPTYYWGYDQEQVRTLMAEADAGSADVYAAKMKEAATLLADDAAACWLWLMPNLVVARTGIRVPANATTLSFDLASVTARS